ncbi:MAG: alcohol dehydrogenase [Betaproteobacteria bacterium]|nr:alcohol dehydrogenase [Betaproteobacteria bacterium]
MKPWIALSVALAIAALALFAGINERDDTPATVFTGKPAEQIERGRYLALAGNCAGCHTARGGADYAGGRAVETPFGNVYASNLTPDAKTGIGVWTADDFWRAMHHGKSKDGKLLYPAFPYPNYTRVTRADTDALFAYLRTVPPVEQAAREHTLRFPYNNRFLLAGWRLLYFKPGVFEPVADRDAAWNRGAYLVQGLGHCNACHTGRTALGGTDLKADLAGGMIPMLNWYAPSLTSDVEAGLGDWQIAEIVQLLKTGVAQRSAIFGPMSEVVYRSLQHLSASDVQAMAAYLKSLPQTRAPADSGGPPVAAQDMQRIMARGAKLYEDHCTDCHGSDGAGKPPAYPPLAGNRALTMRSAVNPIRMVLNGGFPPGTNGNPRPYGMPPFRPTLNDDEVAAVVSYVRNSWGNRAGLVSPLEVDRFRSASPD